MPKRIFQYALIFICAGILALVQFSFVSGLPDPAQNFDLPIIAFIFAFLLMSRDRAWFLAGATGWFLDAMSFHPFGISTLALLGSAIIVYLVLENVFTNRSLYSFLLLAVIGITSEALISNALMAVFDWQGAGGRFFLWSAGFWEGLAWSLLLGLVAIGLLFNLLAAVSRRLQPFFLKER
ncbi:MAG: hypothetical protein ACM3PZ_03895 [Bacillota bacterium]